MRSREEHFRLLADSVPQLVWTAGPDGRIEYMSARRERYGATGRTDWEGLIHPDDRRATAQAWIRAGETGLPYEMEHRLFVVGKGYAWHLSRASPLLDAHGAVVRWYGTTTDIDDQKQREENIRDLMAELNHRSRNLLAVAQAIARCGVANATTINQFQARYSERLLGLATSQDLLTDRNWRGVPLEALVRAQAAAVCASREKRLATEGPMILLSPHATQTLGLALHELCDNALKHGALSNDDGDVSLVWRIDESGAEPNLEMTWRERGGPPVKANRVSGFGAVVLERLTASGLNASSILSFEVGGVDMATERAAEGGCEDRKQRLPVSGSGGSGPVRLIEPGSICRVVRLSNGGFSCGMRRASHGTVRRPPGDLPNAGENSGKTAKEGDEGACSRRSVAARGARAGGSIHRRSIEGDL